MLSFDTGKAIALIRGGKLNGDLIYVQPLFKQGCAIQEIHVPDGIMVPLPNPDIPVRWYVGGSSGCGKSTALASFAKCYQTIHLHNKIYVFKRETKDDPALEGLNFKEVDIARTTEFELCNYRNALLIFDDVGNYPDKEKRQQMYDLQVDALENGRKRKVSVCITSHQLYEGKKTAPMLLECSYITVFPGDSNHQIKSLCDRYVGMNNKQIDKLIHLPSRWVQIYKAYPQYVVYDSGAYIL